VGKQAFIVAKFDAADALLAVQTTAAIREAFLHFYDMLDLNKHDHLGAANIYPCVLLRLGQEMEFYEFVRSWAIHGKTPASWEDEEQEGNNENTDGEELEDQQEAEQRNSSQEDNDQEDHTNAGVNAASDDLFEATDVISRQAPLAHLVMLALFKVHLRMDLETVQRYQSEPEEWRREVGETIQAAMQGPGIPDVPQTIEMLKHQFESLFQTIHDRNPNFWGVFIDRE